MSATDDPVRVLIAAAQQGLLEYVGYTGADRYEVRVAGEVRQLRADTVLPMVNQLRAVQRLRDTGVAVDLLEVGDDTRDFRLSTGRVLHTIPSDEVVDWVDGYLAAAARNGVKHAGTDQIDRIRKVLVNPGIADQARMVILGLMYGDPDSEMSMEDLAVQLPRTKKTVIAALSFGGNLAPDLADLMIAAFGRRWRVTADGDTPDLPDVEGPPVTAEMPGLVRLRLIDSAARSGWLRYVGDASPNRARWLKSYPVAVGDAEYVVPAGSLAGWLTGLEAWHVQNGRRSPRR